MDFVQVKELRFQTIVGCWDWERQTPQQVSIDLDMGWDFAQAAKTDELKHALNYKEVAQRVEVFVQEAKFELVEAAAVGIADMVMQEFSVPWIRVAFHKPYAVKKSRSVGVVVERGTRD